MTVEVRSGTWEVRRWTGECGGCAGVLGGVCGVVWDVRHVRVGVCASVGWEPSRVRASKIVVVGVLWGGGG